MADFRIVAIRTGKRLRKYPTDKGLELNPLKVLQPNSIYCFYSLFKFPDNTLQRVDFDPAKDMDYYSLYFGDHRLPININAIVGENGSGKSTLAEVLYWCNYNLGCRLRLFDSDDPTIQEYKFLDAEVLYVYDGTLVCMQFKKGHIYRQNFDRNGNTFKTVGKKLEVSSIEDVKDFFYTIVHNTSHYSLNSDEIGSWIETLFHKNDGYQTPIVLNPLRTNGTIDIKIERNLVKRRFLAILFENVNRMDILNSSRNIGNGKIAKQIKIKFNLLKNLSVDHSELIAAIEKHFKFKVRSSQDDLTLNLLFSINGKLAKMSERYDPFKKYFKEKYLFNDVDGFIKDIRDSDSHIVFKIKGLILHLKYFDSIYKDEDIDNGSIIERTLDEYASLVEMVRSKENFYVNTFMMAPPSFCDVDILFDKGSFNMLSSGEKQRVYSISSVIYHLINLNSVEDFIQQKTDNHKYIRYQYLNIVLDEIELYYHPEWQRTYIADLLGYIKKAGYANLKHIKGINFTFLTHSPYILSDIPASNIMRMQSGVQLKTEVGQESFGANIHELLANDFFMRHGVMGEFAKIRTKLVISYLSNPNKKFTIEERQQLKFVSGEAKLKQFIDSIGEPLIRNSMTDLYRKNFQTKNDLERELASIAAELKRRAQ